MVTTEKVCIQARACQVDNNFCFASIVLDRRTRIHAYFSTHHPQDEQQQQLLSSVLQEWETFCDLFDRACVPLSRRNFALSVFHVGLVLVYLVLWLWFQQIDSYNWSARTTIVLISAILMVPILFSLPDYLYRRNMTMVVDIAQRVCDQWQHHQANQTRTFRCTQRVEEKPSGCCMSAQNSYYLAVTWTLDVESGTGVIGDDNVTVETSFSDEDNDNLMENAPAVIDGNGESTTTSIIAVPDTMDEITWSRPPEERPRALPTVDRPEAFPG